MYEIINRGYGVLLQDDVGELDVVRHRAIIVDIALAMFMDELAACDAISRKKKNSTLWGDPNNWDETALVEFVSGFANSVWIEKPYSGAGYHTPCLIGIELGSWAASDLEGPTGLVAGIRTPLTEADIEKYEQTVPQQVKDLLAKHGYVPGEVWYASTS